MVEELKKIIRGEVSQDAAVIETHSEDKSPFHVTPHVVIFPADTSDVSATVAFVAKNKVAHPEYSITARSAGTDVGGGPLGESIILDFTKHCNNLVSITHDRAVVQPGMYYRDFETETLKHDLLLPSFPASRSICAVGGMVANNSGGEKTLAYGKTEKYVKGLRVVLADGNEYEFGELTHDELTNKLSLATFEGEVYRKIYELITDNFEILQQAAPHVSKNSAGYALWNVWDPHRNTFDLTKLFVGSQGTLGIITEIEFTLIKPQPLSQMLVIFADDLKKIPDIVHAVLQHKPEAFEVYDRSVLKIIFRYFFKFVSMLGGNIFNFFIDFLPEFKIILSSFSIPHYILTAEFTGSDMREINARIAAAEKKLAQYPVKTHATTNDREVKKYHTIRRDSFALLQQHTKNKQTVTFIDDLIVLPDLLPSFIPALREKLDKYPDITYAIIGHVGDGNLHVIPLMNLSDPKSKQTVEQLTKEVNALVLQFKGSITAEHNDGLTRSPFLKDMYGPEVYALFEKTKQIFDPQNIFNPGKKVHSHFSYALDHLKQRS